MLERLKVFMEGYEWVVDPSKSVNDGYYMRSPDGSEFLMLSSKIGMHRDVAKKLKLDEEEVLRACQ